MTTVKLYLVLFVSILVLLDYGFLRVSNKCGVTDLRSVSILVLLDYGFLREKMRKMPNGLPMFQSLFYWIMDFYERK